MNSREKKKKKDLIKGKSKSIKLQIKVKSKEPLNPGVLHCMNADIMKQQQLCF